MKASLRDRWVTLLVILGFFILPLALLWQQTLGGKTLIPADVLFGFRPWKSAAAQFGTAYPQNHLLADLVLENYAWKRFILESLGRGEIPLWNPYTFAGEPFFANGQHSALYPFSLILYVIPLPQAYGWFTVSQLWLAGVWMYLLGRVLGLRRASAVIAAVTYQLSAFFVFSVVFSMVIAAAAWLPFILAMAELLIRQQPALGGRPARAPWAVLGALGLGIAMLAGHPEMIYPYTLFVTGVFALWRLLATLRRLSGLRKVIPTVAWLAVMVGSGLALGAIQFMPMLEMARLNFREGAASFQQVLGWSYPWRRIIAFLIPNFFGNESHHAYLDVFSWQTLPAKVYSDGQYIWWGLKNSVEGAAYLGILPLVLAVLGIFRVPTFGRNTGKGRKSALRRLLTWLEHPYVPFFTALALFSLALVFPTRLYAVIYHLPGLGQLHTPFRWIFPYTLAVAVLAGFGADFLARTRQDAHHQDTQTPSLEVDSPSLGALVVRVGWVLFWSGLAFIVVLLLSRFAFPSLTLRLADATVARLARADTTFANGRMFYSYLFPWLFIFGLMVMASGIVVRVSRCPIYIPFRRRPIWELLAVSVIVLDLFACGYGFNPAVDPRLLDHRPPVLDFLKRDTGLWRFTTYDPRGLKTMNMNSGWWNGLQDVRGYDSMFPRQYLRYIQTIEQQNDYFDNRVGPVRDARSLDSPMLDMLNVKYVITEDPIPNTKFTLVYDKEVRVYRNEAAAPRAFTLPQTCTVYADDELAALGKYDPRQYVILARGTRSGQKAASSSASCILHPATVTVYKSNEVWIDVDVKELSWLVLGDSYFPGWVAYVRPWKAGEEQEKELTITRADGNFRAVQLEPGTWTVRFRYSPMSFKLGAFTTFIAAMMLTLITGVYVWRYAYRESAQDSAARRVAKNSFTAIVLTLMTRVLELAFAMLMARILGPEGIGRFYFAVVIFGWFDVFTSFGLQTLLMREVARDRSQGNRYLLNTALLRVGLAAAGVPVLAGFIVVFQGVSASKLTPDTILTLALLYVGLLPNSLAYGLTGLFYAYEKAEYPAAITVVTVLIRIAIGVPVLVLTRSIVAIAAVSVVVNTMTLIILGTLATRMFFRPRWESNRALQRSMLRESFPLMINNLLASLFFKVDVTLLKPLGGDNGDKVVGWYNQAYKWVDALNVIPSYFTLALFPVLARQAAEDKDAARRSYHLAVKLLVMLALPTAVLTTFFARELTTIITFGDPRFQPDATIALQLMIWSIPFGWINSVTNYVLIALGQQRKLTNAFLIGLGFNVIANLIFIPLYSYQAAAVITILSEIVEGSAFYWYIRKGMGPVPWAGLLWKVAGAGAVMLATMFFVFQISALLALFVGLGVYPATLIALRAFGPDERAVLAPVLPRCVR